MGYHKHLWLFAVIILQILRISECQSCDYYQNMALGQDYYVYNKEYPYSYSQGADCRWVAKSPPNTKIELYCEDIDMPYVSFNFNTFDSFTFALLLDSRLSGSQSYGVFKRRS